MENRSGTLENLGINFKKQNKKGMKILIVGNMGYIGPWVAKQLRSSFPGSNLIGFDIGYFSHCLTNPKHLPEVYLDQQIFGDKRNFPEELLNDVDAVIDLAAISNDPMGKEYEEITYEVNYRAAVSLAKKSKKAGVKSFVFASSCSMYGAASEFAKTETDSLNPLTAYAKSKVKAEEELEPLASGDFTITCHRFATACGWSNRLRLDLVLNDFIAGAVANKEISILSDGSPWRPLINPRDMARAIEWSATRKGANGGNFLAVNTGANDWNVQIKDLATSVAEIIPGVDLSINTNAEPDKRSYQVNFDLFKSLAPNHQPIHKLDDTIEDLYNNLGEMNFSDTNYRSSQLVRLHVLSKLKKENILTTDLKWNL